MKMIPTRELAARSGRIMDELEKEGLLVVTKDGKPRSIMLPTSDATLLNDVRDCIYVRAQQALAATQLESVSRGRDQISMDEIDAEIRAARTARRKRKGSK